MSAGPTCERCDLPTSLLVPDLFGVIGRSGRMICRHCLQERQWEELRQDHEDFVLGVAERMIDLAKELTAENAKLLDALRPKRNQ